MRAKGRPAGCGVEHLPRGAAPRRRRTGRLGRHGPDSVRRSRQPCHPRDHQRRDEQDAEAVGDPPGPVRLPERIAETEVDGRRGDQPDAGVGQRRHADQRQDVADGLEGDADDRLGASAARRRATSRRSARARSRRRPRDCDPRTCWRQVDRGQHRQHRRPPLARRQQQDRQRQAGRRPDRRQHTGRDEELIREVVRRQVGERQQHHANAIARRGFRGSRRQTRAGEPSCWCTPVIGRRGASLQRVVDYTIGGCCACLRSSVSSSTPGPAWRWRSPVAACSDSWACRPAFAVLCRFDRGVPGGFGHGLHSGRAQPSATAARTCGYSASG